MLSIIVPVHHGPSITKRCLESVVRNTDLPFEIIIVDNDADKETKSVLEEFVHRCDKVTIIRNSENVGYPVACNQGFLRARGEYVAVMNNDVVVTPSWAGRLLDALTVNPALGAVGPRTNFAVGPQRVEGACYTDVTLDSWAEEWHYSRVRSRLLVPRLIGFLMMIKREVIEQIGGFDPLFGVGNFEDDDFSLRAQLAGYKLAIADDVFVHHEGSQSFKRDPTAYIRLMDVNRRLFEAKWDIRFHNGAYNPLEVLQRQGYRKDDLYVPLLFESVFAPNVEPLDLGVSTSRRFLCIPDPSDTEDGWLACVENYLRVFGPRDDATLIIRVEPTTEEWFARVAEGVRTVAKRLNVDVEDRDDLVIDMNKLPAAERGRAYRTANVFIPLPGVRAGSVTREARACGLAILDSYGLDAFLRVRRGHGPLPQ